MKKLAIRKFVKVCSLAAVMTTASTASAGDEVLLLLNLALFGVAPVAMGVAYGATHTPPIRMFGTEKAVYGFDWGSLACKADNVYGAQLSICGGGVTESLYGLQCGILASGFVKDTNLEHCVVYGAQYGTFAAQSVLVDGMQISGVMSRAQRVNGLELSQSWGWHSRRMVARTLVITMPKASACVRIPL